VVPVLVIGSVLACGLVIVGRLGLRIHDELRDLTAALESFSSLQTQVHGLRKAVTATAGRRPRGLPRG
jgi:hypothetical protein